MDNQKIILVIDTAMVGCGVCVYDAARDAVFDAYHDEAHGQAQRLVPLIQGVLNDAGVGFDALSDVIVCHGPGTFTGIRIGLSTAGTLGLVLGVPVVGITSLQALALSARAAGVEGGVLGLVETRRQDFYVQAFDGDGAAVDEAQSIMGEDVDVKSRVLIGNAVERFDPEYVYERGEVSRIDVGCVARAFVQGVDVFSDETDPIYLRAPDVSQPKNPPRKLSIQ